MKKNKKNKKFQEKLLTEGPTGRQMDRLTHVTDSLCYA